MASKTLYPPIVDSYTPAFIAMDESAKCKIYFSLSKFSSPISDIKSIHFSVTKQSSGENVINFEPARAGRFGATGTLIVNCGDGGVIIPVEGQENLYYTELYNSDIKNGWTKSWIYKIQMRFSNESYDSSMGQAAWLTQYANSFSEWSTFTITKAIDKPAITIPMFNYDSAKGNERVNATSNYSIFSTTFDFSGSYSNTDESEMLYSYRLKLKDESGLLEDSGTIYASTYVPNQFKYLFKKELLPDATYALELEYETVNKYTETLNINFDVAVSLADIDRIVLLTAEDPQAQLYTSVAAEEEDGRIGLKLYSEDRTPYFGNVCIRRSDSRTNFTEWDDIAILSIEVANAHEDINDLPLVYDYTVESGVWYKYGLQFIDLQGNRSAVVEHVPIKREFEYAFLLGENGKQLRLLFDNTLGSVKSNFSDAKVNTLGGKYPFITRNGNMNYKTFPVNGLITFNMDEDNLFASLNDIYNYSEVAKLYQKDFRGMYDYTREREFRNKVLDFLQDGKPKLFKSPTEGNVIVRLMDVNTTPNQSLGRLVYSFTSTANEIAEASMKNYLKYKFHTVANYSEYFAISEQKLGQLNLTVPLNTDLLTLVRDKYNKINSLGTNETVVSIENIELTFLSPKTVLRLNDITTGYEIAINQDTIKISGDYRNLGEVTLLPGFDTLKITQAGTDPVELVMDFTYTLKITPHGQKHITKQTVVRQLGQFQKRVYSNAHQGERIYDQIYNSFFYDWDTEFRELKTLRYAAIEAAPGTVFKLWDFNDKLIEPQEHVINETGVLDLYDLGELRDIEFVGNVVTDENGEQQVAYEAEADVIIDYECDVLYGYYDS